MASGPISMETEVGRVKISEGGNFSFKELFPNPYSSNTMSVQVKTDHTLVTEIHIHFLEVK